jgi:hypothetical protein
VGPVSAFAFAGAAGVVAVLSVALRGKTLPAAPAIPPCAVPAAA